MRSKFKGIYITKYLFKNITNKSGSFLAKLKFYARASHVPKQLSDRNVLIYNGKQFKPFKLTPLTIFHRLGEFVFTRIFHTPEKNKKKNKKNKR